MLTINTKTCIQTLKKTDRENKKWIVWVPGKRWEERDKKKLKHSIYTASQNLALEFHQHNWAYNTVLQVQKLPELSRGC